MPTVKVTVLIEKDGVALDPITRRVEVDESQTFDYEKAGTSDATYAAVPTGELGTVQLLLVRTDHAVTLRLDGQSNAGIELGAGGLLLLVGATIDAGATTNVTVNNATATAALLQGIAGGT